MITEDGTRIIRYQFRRGGVVHLTWVIDYHFDNDPDRTCHVTNPYETICGKNIPIGSGGWGYGPKKCTDCFSQAAPAERIHR